MASKSQKFNASVNFGAEIDPSMTRTMNRLGVGINHMTVETEKLGKTQTAWQRELKSGSSSTLSQIKKVEQATEALIHKQASLEKGIREGIKTNKAGTAFLVDEYEKVGVMIGRARKELELLNKAEQKEKRQEAARAKWAQRGESLTSAGRSALASTAMTAVKAPLALAGAGVGLIGGVVALNKKTAEEYRLAQQYGMSFRHYKAGSILAEQAGLNGENFGDLSEELSNKLGEQGNDKTINPLLWQLGISGKSALKGTKQQQYDQVMQKISQAVMSKKMTAQQGESLADQLMGGEANKLMTYIISTGQSYEQVMKNADKLNNLSEEEARAALESSQTLSNIWTSAETSLQGIAGELGKAFEPQLKAWEEQATAWITNNKKLIVNEITAWVDGGGPERVVHGLETFGRAIGAVVAWLDKHLPGNDDRTAVQMDTIQEARQRALEKEAESRGISTAELSYPEALAIGHKAEQDWKDARTRTHVPDYVTFDPTSIGGAIPSIKPMSNQQTNHVNMPVNITVNAAPGQSPEEIGQGVYQKFSGVLPDIPDISGANTFDMPSL